MIVKQVVVWKVAEKAMGADMKVTAIAVEEMEAAVVMRTEAETMALVVQAQAVVEATTLAVVLLAALAAMMARVAIAGERIDNHQTRGVPGWPESYS